MRPIRVAITRRCRRDSIDGATYITSFIMPHPYGSPSWPICIAKHGFGRRISAGRGDLHQRHECFYTEAGRSQPHHQRQIIYLHMTHQKGRAGCNHSTKHHAGTEYASNTPHANTWHAERRQKQIQAIQANTHSEPQHQRPCEQ